MEIKSDEVISYAKAPGYMRTGSSKDSLYRNDKLYLFNGHGDVTSMVDKSGKVTKTYSYDAFGNEINRDKMILTHLDTVANIGITHGCLSFLGNAFGDYSYSYDVD